MGGFERPSFSTEQNPAVAPCLTRGQAFLRDARSPLPKAAPPRVMLEATLNLDVCLRPKTDIAEDEKSKARRPSPARPCIRPVFIFGQ